MGDIYESAFFILAATKAKDSSQGCYSQTEPEFIATAIPGYDDVYIHQETPRLPTRWRKSEETKLSFPLLHRAWCYQEMRLSRRVLHFCAQEVIWECRSMRRSESGNDEGDFGKDSPIYAGTMYEAVPYWKLAETPRLLWYRTVQEYSGLDLTFKSDKMPALAALTQRMESLRVNDQFLAGLWKKTLLLDMLWIVWPHLKHGRPAIRSASTWSWPSVHGQVIWDHSTKSTLSSVRLVDIHYVSTGPSQMGDISEAKITLLAPLIKAGKMFGEFFKDRISYRRTDWQNINEVIAQEDDDQVPVKEIALYDFHEDFHIDEAYGVGSPTDTEIFIIPMGCAVWGSHAGICVRRKADHSTYERFGRVELQHRIALDKRTTEDRIYRSFRDRQDEAGALSSAILESLPLSKITLV